MPKSHDDETRKGLRKQCGRRIKACLDDRKMSQVELARAVGVGPQSVNDWISGRTTPTPDNLKRVGVALKVSVSFLHGDKLYGLDSYEVLSERLARRLKRNRLVALTHVPDEELLDAVDMVIGRHQAEHGPLPNRPAPQSRRARRR